MIHFNEHNFEKRMNKSGVYLEEVVKGVEKKGKISGWRIARATGIEFAKKYIYKRGYRDGTPGLISALHAATAVFRAHALVWDRQNRISRSELEQQVAWKGPLKDGTQGE